MTQVENIKRNGRAIPNQFIIHINEGQIFQSYNSIIAIKKDNGEVLLDKQYWNYSNTTGKYRNLFLNESRKETERKINLGEYKLENLQSYNIN